MYVINGMEFNITQIGQNKFRNEIKDPKEAQELAQVLQKLNKQVSGVSKVGGNEYSKIVITDKTEKVDTLSIIRRVKMNIFKELVCSFMAASIALLISSCSNNINDIMPTGTNISSDDSITNDVTLVANNNSDLGEFEANSNSDENATANTVFKNFKEAENELSNHFIDFGLNAEVCLSHIYNCDVLQSSGTILNFDKRSVEGGTVGTTIDVTEEQYEEIKKGNIPYVDSDIYQLCMQTIFFNGTINDYYIAAAELNNGYLDKVENTTYYSDRIQSEITLYYGRVNNKNIVDNISLAVFSKDNKMYLLTFNYNESSDINGFLAYVESII